MLAALVSGMLAIPNDIQEAPETSEIHHFAELARAQHGERMHRLPEERQHRRILARPALGAKRGPHATGLPRGSNNFDLGRVIASGDPQDVVTHPAVVESYLGGDDAVIHRSGAPANGR
mgnify:CR=1 FL=1